RPALPGGSRRRHRRRGRVLPAAGRAGGVRAAAGSGGHHAGPAPDVEARGHRRGCSAARRPGRLASPGPAPMSGPGSAWGVHGRGQHERDQHGRDQHGGRGPDQAGGPGGGNGRRHGGRGGRGGEQLVVPRARPDSYYGKPILKVPVWGARDVGGYLFFGGLAGASSVLAGFAQAAGNHKQAKASKIAAAGAIGVSGVALVADLGRPERFLNMLRVFKPSSPMSVGSWLISAF